MNRRMFVAGAISAAASSLALAQGTPGQGPGRGPGMGAGPDGRKWVRERLYGSTLMTLEERHEYHRKLWNAKTEAERQQLRTEHRKMVEERAQARKAQIQEQMDDAFFIPALSPL